MRWERHLLTEQVDLALALYTSDQEAFSSKLCQDTAYTDDFAVLLSSSKHMT
jgi:hypothetical protein